MEKGGNYGCIKINKVLCIFYFVRNNKINRLRWCNFIGNMKVFLEVIVFWVVSFY